MAILVGILLALLVVLFAAIVGLDRDRAFYPTVLVVVASYYGLFAAIDGSVEVLAIELLAVGAFVAASIAGFRISQWIVVAALAGHGVLDFFHGQLVNNPGVPAWWPEFCLSFDLMAAACLAWLLSRPKVGAETG